MELNQNIFLLMLIFLLGSLYVLVIRKSRCRRLNTFQQTMKDFSVLEYPELKGTDFSVLSFMDTSLSPEHEWVIAYDKHGLRVMPAVWNGFTLILKKYRKPRFLESDRQLQENIRCTLCRADTTDQNEFIARSSITAARLNKEKKTLTVWTDECMKKFRYDDFDLCGSSQAENLTRFFTYLNVQ